MKKLFGFIVLLTLAFYAFPQFGNRIAWSTPAPTFQEVENRIRALKDAFRFQSPSLSHLSIPYLSILAVQLEATSLPGRHPLHPGHN
jgi:hypothetical protein